MVTLQRIFEAVKQGAKGGIVLLGVAIVGMAAALAAPRATEPTLAFELPSPLPDHVRLGEIAAAERVRANEARRHTLAFPVRAVGEAIRRIGRAAAEPAPNVNANATELRLLTVRALKEGGSAGLLLLRAVQAELFVAACHAALTSGTASSELRELGGDFWDLARASEWVAGKNVLLTDDELALLFRSRWNELTGLVRHPAFAASFEEQRARYALLLRLPAGAGTATRTEHQLGYVGGLEALDRDYPAAFARGVLLYRAGSYDASAAAFRAHLAARRDGPWSLRAGNHLLAALARTADSE
jgi:hypothetical protein